VQQDGLEPPKPNPSKVSLTGLRILAIDDEVDSLEALYSALSDCGAEVMQATSARSGLELFKGGRINAIICDIGMPQEDGYSFIGKLRALEGPKSSWTPAIALTAYARPEDRMQSLSAGFQMHVAKPADPLDLAKLIANLALKGDH